MAAMIGVLAIRTRGIYFAMVTMALSQCVYYLFYQAVDWTGGENGLRGINVRVIDILGVQARLHQPVDALLRDRGFRDRRILCPVAHPGLAIRRGDRSGARKRDARQGLRLRRRRATRLITFVLSGGFCGLAGALQALHLSIVPIEIMHYDTSGIVVMIALLGGMGTFFGPMIGAAAFLLLENLGLALDRALATDRRRGLHDLRAVLPGGNLGDADFAGQAMTAGASPSQTTSILRTRGVGKTFGKFVALNNISAEFTKGAITSIIGPNGAGKSTYFNLLSGALPPTSGSVEFEGRDVTGMPQHRFAHMGIAKSFQITNVFPAAFDPREHPRRAAGAGVALRHVASARATWRVGRAADELLSLVGLWESRERAAKTLAHGEQRALEIGMALASRPRLLLLDEPTAGMSPEETRTMMGLIVKLAERTHGHSGRAQDEAGAWHQRSYPGAAPR